MDIFIKNCVSLLFCLSFIEIIVVDYQLELVVVYIVFGDVSYLFLLIIHNCISVFLILNVTDKQFQLKQN
jgi:hypothetical protein